MKKVIPALIILPALLEINPNITQHDHDKDNDHDHDDKSGCHFFIWESKISN